MIDGPYLEFEKPIMELQKKISDMKEFSRVEDIELDSEIKSMEGKLKKMQDSIFAKLTRWQRVQLARHPKRPYTLDYIDLITTDFVELHGDRCFADDNAMVGGFAKLDGRPVLILGQQKGRNTKSKLYRNFGMANPEGYRKALRLMQMASKFNRPIIILIDTPGAFPGIGAEERGQAESIARNLREMTNLEVPIIITIIGEGASGGALGIGLGDRVFMLENSWYSVISPEGCAAILWRDAAKAPDAAEALKLTAPDVDKLDLIDGIIPEPECGAHMDPSLAAEKLKKQILIALDELDPMTPEELILHRIEKYRKMGVYTT
ncbi:MAG: acetyl-CoA carboxylase carboxyltransferase subunit alpha [candidate division Zixibacteria bacterium]|nr:acetyl-CoA carboxylase carboxyltransferase subunit alpha [candidate division Zixibacteria bacterium]